MCYNDYAEQFRKTNVWRERGKKMNDRELLREMVIIAICTIAIVILGCILVAYEILERF